METDEDLKKFNDMNSKNIKIRELVEVGDVFVYWGCLLTENDVYYMELRLMLQ